MLQANLPNITFPNTLAISPNPHDHDGGDLFDAAGGSSIYQGGGAMFATNAVNNTGGGRSGSTSLGITGGVQSGGSGTALNKMPPTMIVNKIMRII